MALTKVSRGLLSTGIVDNSNATAITIDSSENVGIGTSLPESELHISKGASGARGGTLTIENSNGSVLNNEVQIVLLTDAGGSVAGAANARITAINTNAGNGATDITFTTWNGGSEGERMRIDAAGRVTMPYQPAFLVMAAAQNNIPINAPTTVNFNNEIFDQGSNYAGTSFTAPVTGKYQLNLSLYVLAIDSDAQYVQIAIVTSNRQYYAIVDPGVWTGDPTYWSFAITVLADMDASDTAHVEVQLNNTGAAQMDVTANSAFSGYLVA